MVWSWPNRPNVSEIEEEISEREWVVVELNLSLVSEWNLLLSFGSWEWIKDWKNSNINLSSSPVLISYVFTLFGLVSTQFRFQRRRGEVQGKKKKKPKMTWPSLNRRFEVVKKPIRTERITPLLKSTFIWILLRVGLCFVYHFTFIVLGKVRECSHGFSIFRPCWCW